MISLEKSFLGIEKNLKGDQQSFVDTFSNFLKKAPEFKGVKTTDNKDISEIEKKISVKTISPWFKRDVYGTKEIRDDLEKFISIAIRVNLLRVDYAEITKAVLEVDKDREDVSDKLGDFLVAVKLEYHKILKQFKDYALNLNEKELPQDDQDRESAIVCLGKAIEHARLAHIQYDGLYLETQTIVNSLQSKLQSANSELEETKTKLIELQDDLQKADSEISKYEKKFKVLRAKQSSIYTDFITILGVFSSFVFVMFGGFSALSDIIQSVSYSTVSLTKTLLISSSLFGFLITVLYSLLYWVSIIVDKPFFQYECDCEKPCWNLIHQFAKHRYYLIVMLACMLLFSISLILALLNIH